MKKIHLRGLKENMPNMNNDFFSISEVISDVFLCFVLTFPSFYRVFAYIIFIIKGKKN